MIKKFSVATALVVVLAFQGAFALDEPKGSASNRGSTVGKLGGCECVPGSGSACCQGQKGRHASSQHGGSHYGHESGMHKKDDHQRKGSRRDASRSENQQEDGRKKGFKVSVDGDLGFHFARGTNDSLYQTYRGASSGTWLMAVNYAAGNAPVPDLPNGVFSRDAVRRLIATGQANFVGFTGDPNDGAAYTQAITNANITPQEVRGAVSAWDGNVMGDYGRQDKVRLRAGASLNLVFDNYLTDDISYGGHVHLRTDDAVGENLNSGVKALRARGLAVFIASTSGGMLELGTDLSAAEAMRLDASALSTVDGGIDGPWFRYLNAEGHYTNAINPTWTPAVAPATVPTVTGGRRNIAVRHPFHLLPRLHTEYGRVPNAPWMVQDRATERDYAPKVSVYSPRYSGIRVGVSYTPDQGDTISTFGTSAVLRSLRSDYENVFSGGLSFQTDFQGFGLSLAATGETGKHEDSNTYFDLKGWNVGGIVSYSGFKLGGSYANLGKSGLIKNAIVDYDPTVARPAISALTPGEGSYWTVGGSYSLGPAMFSVTYFESKTRPYEDVSDFENTFSTFAVGVQYDPAFGTGKKARFTPYLSWTKISPKEAMIASSENNSASVWIAGVNFSF